MLTGGTALAAFYLKHRLSEDLDLFTGSDVIAARMRIEFEQAISATGLTVETVRALPTLVEANVQCGDETVAVHLALDAPYRIEPPVEHAGIPLPVDGVLDLAANKLAALYGRASTKDFVDIYFVHHEVLPISELIPKAAMKSPGIEPYWLARAFLLVQRVEVLPTMLKTLTLEQLRGFFIAQAKSLMRGA